MIRVIPFYTGGKFTELSINVTEESIPAFKILLNRALNCWDDAPAELKSLADMVMEGRLLQPYEDRTKVQVSTTEIPFPDFVLTLPICPECGGKGSAHVYSDLSNPCSLAKKKE